MKLKRIYIPVGVFVALILIWEMSIKIAKTPLYLLPAPSDILIAGFNDMNILIEHSSVTLLETVVGILIATLIGVVTAILMDRFQNFYLAFYPVLVVTQTIPIILLTPIFVIYLGFGFAPKVVIVTLMCFFPIAVNFVDGMKNVDDKKVSLARLFGAGNIKVYTIVKIPAALPALFSGMKVAATYSVTGAVVGEWISSSAGLGYYMIRAKNSFMLDKVFACVVMVILLSLFMNFVVHAVERSVIPTHR